MSHSSPASPRPPTAGPPSGPTPPFPLKLSGPVIKGFQRGSKELGIATANIPITGLSVAGHEDLASGVYFGWAGLSDWRAGEAEGREAPKPGDEGQAQNSGLPASAPRVDAVHAAANTRTGSVHAAVLSIGYNPFYGNTVRSVEVHLLSKFERDFYGAELRLMILGFIRSEKDYEGKQALIDDINIDCDVARRSLERDAWQRYSDDGWLQKFGSEDYVAESGREERL